MLERIFSWRYLSKLLEFFDIYPPFVGVDLGTASIKLAVFASRREPVIAHAAIEATPEGAIVDRKIKDVQTLAEALKKALKEANVQSRHGVIAVGGEDVITKIVTLPSDLTPFEVEDQIYEEAEQFLPFPLEEIYLDFHPLGSTRQGREDYLIVAARRESVDRRLEVLEQVGLEPIIVDVEGYALLRSLKTEEKNFALLDLGDSHITFYLFRDGRLVFNRENKFGGKILIKNFLDTTGASNKNLLFDLLKSGKVDDDVKEKVVFPFLQELIQRVEDVTQYVPQDISYQRVYVFGGLLTIPGLCTLFEEAFKKKYIPVDPLSNFDTKRNNKTKYEGPLLGVAIGLAHRYLTFDGSH